MKVVVGKTVISITGYRGTIIKVGRNKCLIEWQEGYGLTSTQKMSKDDVKTMLVR